MPGPLIIPGPDGDDLLDVNAAAEFLGVRVSTLRNHQYQDGRRGAAEPWPQPEDPDAMQIALPDGAGIEWARAIEELLYRGGGAGRPVTLWRRSTLAAFKADRMAAAQDRLGVIEDAVGSLEPWQRDVADAVARGGRVTKDARGRDVLLVPSGDDAVMDAMLYGETWQQAVRAEDGTVQFGESLVRVESDEPKRLTATEVLERARLRREGKLDG